MDVTTEDLYDVNSTFTPEPELATVLTQEAYIGLGVFFLITGLLGAAGNSTVVMMFRINKQLSSSVDALLLNLAVADLGMCVCCFPFVTISSFSQPTLGAYLLSAICPLSQKNNKEFANQRWWFGHGGCVAYGYLAFLLSNASTFTLTAVSVQRYLIVCRRYSSKRGTWTTVTLAVIWVQAVMWSSLPLVLPRWGYALEPFLTSCTLAWASRDGSTRIFIYSMVGWTAVLFLVLTYCYLSIYLTTRRDLIATSSRTHSDLLVSKICFLLVLAFVVCWGPYTFFSLWYPHYRFRLTPVITIFPVILAKVSVCINPLLYIIVSKRFRQLYLSVLCCRCLSPSTDLHHNPCGAAAGDDDANSLSIFPSNLVSEV